MPFLRNGESVTVTVPSGQRIAIGALRGSQASILIPQGLAGGPVSVMDDTTRTFGPWTGLTVGVTVNSSQGVVEFVIGATPVLTDDTINRAAVAITGGTITGTPISGSTGSFTTLAASGAVTMNPASAAVSIAPSGTGNATFGASGTGSTTVTRVGSLTVLTTDTSGTPGNATINTLSGRAAFAAAGSTVVVTNSTVTATSKVFVSLRAGDATLVSVRVTPAAGSFTVTGNAAATAITIFDFFVVN
jgi:hypothetical protein